MKIKLKQHTTAFKILIWLDRGLNVITGGSFQECFSTRAYINHTKSNLWFKIMLAIDWMFWDGHCKDSLKWELRIKSDWIAKNKGLLK